MIASTLSEKCFLEMHADHLCRGRILDMTRSELISAIARRYPQLSNEDIEAAVKTILGSMADSLAQRSRVEIRGFGSFLLNYRSPRTGRNPRTGEKVDVPETYAPIFKAGKELKERVDGRRSASWIAGES